MSSSSYLVRFARQQIVVAGHKVDVFIMGKGADLPIGVDLDNEMDRVSAILAYWSSVVSDAKAEVVKVDASYRRFRAISEAAILEKTPNIAAWKVKAQIEALKGFIQHKNAVAQSIKNVSLVEGMVKGFDKKANQLQSLGAKARSEAGAQGMTTPKRPKTKRGWDLTGKGSEHDDEPTPAPEEPESGGSKSSSEDRINKMVEMNGKRKKKIKGKKPKRTRS